MKTNRSTTMTTNESDAILGAILDGAYWHRTQRDAGGCVDRTWTATPDGAIERRGGGEGEPDRYYVHRWVESGGRDVWGDGHRCSLRRRRITLRTAARMIEEAR